MSAEIEALIFTAFHGELTDAERDTLTRWVVASPANARQFVAYANETRGIEIALHSDQAAQAGETIDSSDSVFQNIECDVMAGIIDQTLATRQHQEEKRFAEESIEVESQKPLLLAWAQVSRTALAVAAVIGLVALIGIGLWSGGAGSPTDTPNLPDRAAVVLPDLEPTRTETLPDKPITLGQVTEAFDSDEIFFIQGDEGNRNRIGNLPYGFAYYSFIGRGVVLLEAPAMWQMLEGNVIRLFEGRLLARSQAGAYNPITILLDHTEIVLHEAEFGIFRNAQDAASIIVYSGSIEVSHDSGDGPYSVTLMRGGQAGVLNTRLGTVQLSPASQGETSRFSTLYDRLRYRPFSMNRSVSFAHQAPRSLHLGEFGGPTWARLIHESPGVILESGVLDLLKQDPANMVWATAGQTVDSYLLHFDPTAEGGAADGALEGTVTFERPVLAIMGSSDSIRATDTRFGSPGTAYPRSPETAGGDEGSESWGIELDQDYITLSDDRKHLSFRLHAGSDLDQFRILVEAR